MPAEERLRRARYPQAPFPPLCVRNCCEPVRNFQFMAGHLFDTPVAVRVKKRNYGDGWIKPEDLELRNAIKLPAWTRVPAQVRRILAAERAGQR
jgi:hypothetical protein